MRIAKVIPALAAALALGAPSAAPAAAVRGDLLPAHGTPRETARAALARYAPVLGVDAASFRFESVRRSLIGTHVRGRQFAGGVPVAGTSAIVSVVRGRVVWVEAAGSRLPGGPADSPVDRAAARSAALGALGVADPAAVAVERLLVPRGARLADVYRVRVLSLAPAVARTVDVAAASAAVLAVRDDSRYADAVAPLFDPNPVVTTRDPGLRQPGVDLGLDTDLDSPALTAARRDLPVREYDPAQTSAGRLSGPWALVQGSQSLVADGGRFDLTRGQPGFETLMAYAHVDRFQRYLQEVLGFRGEAAINAEPQDVYVPRAEGFDNSFYQPGSDVMVFGAGGVDDGEDAEVILHEYGHAVQDAQVPGWGAESEGGAMGEGFGDFQAAAYFARTSGGFQDECAFDWDATSYSSAAPACLRRLDSRKVYPADLANDVHQDGELWSAFLWRLRAGLGTTPAGRSDNALRLVLASHELLTPEAKFLDGVLALRVAAQALGHPEWIVNIDRSALTSGFITEPSVPLDVPAETHGSGAPATTLRIRCRGLARPRCTVRAPAGSRAARATHARLVRRGRAFARGRIRGGRVNLRRTGRVRAGRYTLVLLRSGKPIARRSVRLR